MALDKLLGLLLLTSTLIDCYKEKSCGIGGYDEEPTVPKGGLDVDYVEALAKRKEGSPVPIRYCYSRCCELGPERCQYLWVIWGSCFAVACVSDTDKCQPVPMKSSHLFSSKIISSVYVEVTRTSRTSVSGEEETEGTYTPPREDSKTSVGTDAGPVARAGEDVLVVLPQTSVWLYGNHSSADKEIVYYFWQLIAKDHVSKAQVLHSTSPVARVVDLSPGAYTFSLTVLDSSYKSSSDSVLVTVLAGSHDSTVGVAYTEASVGTPNGTIGNSTLGSEEEDESYSKKRMALKVLLPVLVMLVLVLVFSAVVVLLYTYLCSNNSNTGRKRQLNRYRPLNAIIEDT